MIAGVIVFVQRKTADVEGRQEATRESVGVREEKGDARGFLIGDAGGRFESDDEGVAGGE